MEIYCLKLVRLADGHASVDYLVGKERAKIRSEKPRQLVHSNIDWSYYTMYAHWEEKTVEEIQRICNYISKYSDERGWKMQLEFNQSSVIFRRSPRELKEKFSDKRIIVLKSYWWKPDDKVRMFFNCLRDKDEKPDGKFDYKYDKPNKRWYFDIERDGRLELDNYSDFTKVLEQSYNASTKR